MALPLSSGKVMPRPSNCNAKFSSLETYVTNLYSFQIPKLKEIYRYRVEIKTARENTFVPRDQTEKASVFNRRIFSHAFRLPSMVFNGSNAAYAPIVYEEGRHYRKEVQLEVTEEGDPIPNGYQGISEKVKVTLIIDGGHSVPSLDEFKVFGTGANAENLNECFHAISAAIRQFSADSLVESKRMFYPEQHATTLNSVLSVRRGFYPIIQVAREGLFVSLLERTAVFIRNTAQGELSLLHFMKNCLNETYESGSGNRGKGNRSRRDEESLPPTSNQGKWRSIKDAIRKLVVCSPHFHGYKRILGLDFNPTAAPTTYYGRTVPLEEFLNACGIRRWDRSLPAVVIEAPSALCVPLESVIVMQGRPYAGSLSPKQQSQVKLARPDRPDLRQNTTRAHVMHLADQKNNYLKLWGIKYGFDARYPQTVPVSSHVLQAPTGAPILRGKQESTGHRGSSRPATFLKAVGIKTWLILEIGVHLPDRGRQALEDGLTRAAQVRGMHVHSRAQFSRIEPDDLASLRVTDIRRVICDRIQRQMGRAVDGGLVVVVKQKEDNVVYNSVKQACNLDLGVVSQCLLERKLLAKVSSSQRDTQEYFDSVISKVNTKLGGANYEGGPKLRVKAKSVGVSSTFMRPRSPYMVVGADVSHPPPGSDRPSVAAVVGSVDDDLFRYGGTLRNQDSRVENISNMGEMVGELYQNWKKCPQNRNRQLRSIIVFRDGVSETQFSDVLRKEFNSIRTHCQTALGFDPKITFIIIAKRHNARFFPLDAEQSNQPRRQSSGRSSAPRQNNNQKSVESKNIRPGRVVDDKITHAVRWEFFLNSHRGIKGTSRPSKYTVLHDDNAFSANELYTFIYDACHGFARSEHPVSMVTAAFYAHLLAYQGSCLLPLRPKSKQERSKRSSSGSSLAKAFEKSVSISEKTSPLVAIHPLLRDGMYFV